jgi:molecular chaperone GrpE
MSTTDDGLWPEEPVPAEVQPKPRAGDEADVQRNLAETEDRLHRVVAELDNTRKRNARQAADLRAGARAEAAAAWLPIIDNLDRALESATQREGSARCEGLVDGVAAARDQAVGVLESLGFRRHAETRVPFDPFLHEAVGVTYDVDAEPGTVVQVVRPGYGEGGRQLRPTGVVVAGVRE